MVQYTFRQYCGDSFNLRALWGCEFQLVFLGERFGVGFGGGGVGCGFPIGNEGKGEGVGGVGWGPASQVRIFFILGKGVESLWLSTLDTNPISVLYWDWKKGG